MSLAASFGMRHVGHMARLHFDRFGVGALCHHAFLFRIDRSVFACHHVKGRLVLPGGILNLMGERVSRNRHLCYSHELCLIPWDVRCEVSHEMRLVDPPKPVAVGVNALEACGTAVSIDAQLSPSSSAKAAI
jgi:hypothetical protein